jgi:hypothetical protein
VGFSHITKFEILGCDSHDVPRAGATCLPTAAIVVVGHGRNPLRTLFAPLLAALGALLGAVDGDVRRRLLATTWGHHPASWGKMKFNRLAASGVLGGDATYLLGGVPENIVVFALA